jgi:hypothetical protein
MYGVYTVFLAGKSRVFGMGITGFWQGNHQICTLIYGAYVHSGHPCFQALSLVNPTHPTHAHAPIYNMFTRCLCQLTSTTLQLLLNFCAPLHFSHALTPTHPDKRQIHHLSSTCNHTHREFPFPSQVSPHRLSFSAKLPASQLHACGPVAPY